MILVNQFNTELACNWI